ncbi:MAG: hypothetical protein RMJ88_11300 [Thermogemmata sp.]|nr:hypothetical protein [Thermogemmata sp.]
MKSNVARLRLEALEEREVPSTVTVTVTGIHVSAGGPHLLRIDITGDGANNSVTIEHDAPTTGRIRILAGSGTTLTNIVGGVPGAWVVTNTATQLTIQPSGLSNNYVENVSVNMGGGNDVVILKNLRATAGVFTQITGSLTVILGDGDDQLQVQNVEVKQNVSIYGGIGKDEVYYLAPASTDQNIVGGNLLVDLGLGNNIFTVTTPASTTTPNLEVKGGSVTILSAGGDDVVRFGNSTTSTTSVSFKHSGPGATVIQTGGGKDRVLVQKAEFGITNIDTGGGDDRLRLQDAIFGLLVGLLGAGNDVVNLVGTSVFGGGSLIDGGPGSDSYTGTPPATLTLISFP